MIKAYTTVFNDITGIIMPFIPRKNIECVKCGAKAIARKLCRPCYAKAKKDGSINKFHKLQGKDIFFTKIEKFANGCWEWQGTKHQYGYGIIIINNKSIRAHRFAYELLVEPIPKGKIILHSCDNPPCVNPAHLRVGTKLDNNRDAHAKGRRAKGEDSHLAKLSNDEVELIMSDPRSQKEIAQQYNVSQSQISRLKTGRRRKLQTK